MNSNKMGKLAYIALGVIGVILALASYLVGSYFVKYLALVLLGLSLMINGYVTYLKWKSREPFIYLAIGFVVVVIAIGEIIRLG
ncbi:MULTISPECIES: hypothetical protein [Priestia]|uniref:hypothetical protein n=1 Tax=Priestia TaxID=2800373 RepID=UPI000762B2D3|nr:hypothetical protein [Priestia megaterium]KWU61020.1 hypothetical protein AWX17_19545 [Priestia megaterium]MCE4092806.1 hypothetical protein [Priestia megaterium]